MSARSHRQRCFATSQLNSLPPSLRKTRGMPKVKHNWSKCCATPSSLLVGMGNAKGNLDALSTASKMYSLPAKEVVPIRRRSTSISPMVLRPVWVEGPVAGCCFVSDVYSRMTGRIRVRLLPLWAKKIVLVLGRGLVLPRSTRVGNG